MSNQKIGGAHYTLSVNADKFAQGLAQAKEKAQRFKKETDNVWGKIGDKFGGGGGDFVAKSLGAGFFGGIAGALAIRGMDKAREAISDLIGGTEKWKNEFAKVRLEAQLTAQHLEFAKGTRDEFTAIADPADRIARLREDLSEASKGRVEAMADLDRLRKRAEVINSAGITNARLWLGFDLVRSQTENAAAIAEAEARLLKFSATAEKTHTALDRMLDPVLDPRRTGELKTYLAELEARVRDVGLSAEEVKHRAMTAGGGPKELLSRIDRAFGKASEADYLKNAADFTKELDAAVNNLGKSSERIKADSFKKIFGEPGVTFDMARAYTQMSMAVDRLEAAQNNKAVWDYTKQLQAQRAALEFGAEGAKLLELRQRGVNRELLMGAAIEAELLAKMKAATPEFRSAGAIEVGSSAAYSLNLKHSLDKSGGADPNKGVGLSELLDAMLRSAKTLDKIEKKVGPGGVF